MTQRRTGPLSVTVAALTRRRPVMLGQLLDSLGRMKVPDDVVLTCLVVENDDAPRTREVTEARTPLPNGAVLAHVHEPQLGIPFGRTRAAREAIAAHADLLAFVDDDEVVAEDWLVRFTDGYRNCDAVLLGGPLRVVPKREATFRARLLHRAVARRYRRKERRAAARAGAHGTPGVTIVTNNWLGETALFSRHDLWFDEQMRFTGGTDSKFCAEVKAKGLPTAWVADAVAYEEIPPDRLSLAYQYARGRDQSATHFHRKIAERPHIRWTALVSVPLKAASILGLVAALPVTRGESLMDIARAAGWISGRLIALTGRRSHLYETVTGS